jgi:hypothetical protein
VPDDRVHHAAENMIKIIFTAEIAENAEENKT